MYIYIYVYMYYLIDKVLLHPISASAQGGVPARWTIRAGARLLVETIRWDDPLW